jgi:hypothetical protein
MFSNPETARRQIPLRVVIARRRIPVGVSVASPAR